MENNTFPNSPSGETKPSGTNEGGVPLQNIPAENVTMQTMNSDIKSMKENGGGAPTPYMPKQNGVVIPGQNNGGSQPPTPLQTENFQGDSFPPQGPKKSGKGALVGIISFLVVVGLGLAGYFFIYPLFEDNGTTPPPTTNQNEPQDQASITPTSTSETNVPPVTESSTPITSAPTSTEPQTPPEIIHASLFKNSADVTAEISLSSLTLGTYKSSIENATADVPLFKEIIFRSDNKVLSFDELMQFLAPQTFTDTKTDFNQDVTFFTYTDSDGTWPGFVVKLSPTSNKDALQTKIKTLESNGESKNLFFSDPGIIGEWNDGKVGTFSGRYSQFSLKGASFNYFFTNNSLVVSTNYLGAKEALNRLGL